MINSNSYIKQTEPSILLLLRSSKHNIAALTREYLWPVAELRGMLL